MYRFRPQEFSSSSDVTIATNTILIEERCRYKDDMNTNNKNNNMIPIGPRTLLLRNNMAPDIDFDHGEMGDDFYTIDIPPPLPTSTSLKQQQHHHNGAGNDVSIQTAIVGALYITSSPELWSGQMMELASSDVSSSSYSGLSSLLGCIGAGYVSRYNNNNSDDSNSAMRETDDDVLTFGKDRNSGPFPTELDSLSITNVVDEETVAMHNNRNLLKASGLHSGYQKVKFEVLDWRRTRSIPPPRNSRLSSTSSPPEYRTIIATDIVFSYPETKELARTVAHRLEPIASYIYNQPPPKQSRLLTSTTTTPNAVPSFVHVCPENRDEIPYLRRILEKGYRMTTTTKYLTVEKIIFQLQTLPAGTSEEALDDLELEVQEYKEMTYQALIAQHHPDYNGGGEWFFPMETGEYDAATGGATELEKETGGFTGPW